MTARLTWLIDTNVVSEIMRPQPEPRVAAFLDRIADEGIGLASATVWEVLDDHVLDPFLVAAAATRGLTVVTRNTGEFRNTGVETVDPWVAEPR